MDQPDIQANKRTEYVELRKEQLQADQAYLLMTGFIIAAMGVLHSKDIEWLCSILSLIGIFYYTEKRFLIRTISNFIQTKISKENSGIEWDLEVDKLRKEGKLRPFMILRPYNTELILCSIVALSPISSDILCKLSHYDLHAFTWILFAVITLAIAIVNYFKYSNLNNNKVTQQG